MKTFFKSKRDVVEYVNAKLLRLEQDSALTMTITRESYEDFSVIFVTEELSEDTELQRAKFFSETQVNT
jgi:hypothetical protein